MTSVSFGNGAHPAAPQFAANNKHHAAKFGNNAPGMAPAPAAPPAAHAPAFGKAHGEQHGKHLNKLA